MKTLLKTLVLTIGIASLASAARNDYGYANRGPGRVNAGVVAYRIPRSEFVVVRDYYRGQRFAPGVRFTRGGYLPSGWQRRIRPVPVIVERRLAPLPYGYRRGIYDGAYVVYDSRRGVVVDFFASF
jgi:hypothetical protein